MNRTYDREERDKEMMESEKIINNAISKDEVKKGGARPGAGRPRGSKNAITKRVEMKEADVKKRIIKHFDELISAQLTLAKGVSYLYKIEMKNVGGRRKPVHILVTNPKEIQKYLDGDASEEYYYITADKPDRGAIDSLLDRTLGKAGQKNQTDHNLSVNIINYDEKTKIAGTREAELIDGEDDSDSPQLHA